MKTHPYVVMTPRHFLLPEKTEKNIPLSFPLLIPRLRSWSRPKLRFLFRGRMHQKPFLPFPPLALIRGSSPSPTSPKRPTSREEKVSICRPTNLSHICTLHQGPRGGGPFWNSSKKQKTYRNIYFHEGRTYPFHTHVLNAPFPTTEMDRCSTKLKAKQKPLYFPGFVDPQVRRPHLDHGGAGLHQRRPVLCGAPPQDEDEGRGGERPRRRLSKGKYHVLYIASTIPDCLTLIVKKIQFSTASSHEVFMTSDLQK